MGLRSVLGKLADLVARHALSNALRVACQRFKGAQVGKQVYIGYDVNIDEAWPGSWRWRTTPASASASPRVRASLPFRGEPTSQPGSHRNEGSRE